ncbi:methyltransferase [Brachybacterium vulturis]|uniref:methyltransferase n=1 Tax=Brachybacterium vulturis TaxID=2017484 RepID=UPI003734EDF6
MQHSSAERDFSGYNAAQAERSVRPLAIAAVDAAGRAGEVSRRTAIDLGCGRGIEARFLAESGYEVHVFDVDPSVAPALGMLAAELPVHPEIIDLAEIEDLPGADLVLACAALPFLRRDAFDGLWSAAVAALRPGGILAVDLFGVHDDWATTEGTYLTRAEVERLLAGFEVIELAEEQHDGRSFSGPKHWHTFRILARRP